MGKVIWIPADIKEDLIVQEQDEEIEWEIMQKYVDGYIEHVHIKPPGDEKMAHMFVNEEGLIRQFPHNTRATEHYFRAMHDLGRVPELTSPGIKGNAILLLDIPLQGYDFMNEPGDMCK